MNYHKFENHEKAIRTDEKPNKSRVYVSVKRKLPTGKTTRRNRDSILKSVRRLRSVNLT